MLRSKLYVLAMAVAAAALHAPLAHSQARADREAAERAELTIIQDMDGCANLQRCFAKLEALVLPDDLGRSRIASKGIATNLRRFGGAAKQELLWRATDGHRGWRNLAGDILMSWADWSPADVPALRAALRREHGGWLARPLGKIGTPEAIEALVEDLPFGAESQTGWALKQLGAKVLPSLLPVLASDKHREAASVVGGIGKEALVIAPDWVTLALGDANPKPIRLAALRGLAAMREEARAMGTALHGLLDHADKEIREQSFETLVSLRDPFVVETVAKGCRPSGARFRASLSDLDQSIFCLWKVARFEEQGRAAGPHLMRFLGAAKGDEIGTAVAALGQIGYMEAAPEIMKQLQSPDWRVVYTAAQSLGWLGAKAAIGELERVASNHWLPEVRERAKEVVFALRSPEGRLPRVTWREFAERDPFFIDSYRVLSTQPACSSGKWKWREIEFTERGRSRQLRLPLGNGELIGIIRSRQFGELTWKPTSGESQRLIEDDFVSMEPAKGGAVVLFSSVQLDYGYVVHVQQRADGSWSLHEVARLPTSADALATIAPGLYVAWSGSRAVVFSEKEVLGLAQCAGS
jgi:HEAT repeat protein